VTSSAIMLTCQQFFYDGGQSPRVLERLQTAALRSSTCAGERRTEPHSRLKFSRWNPTGELLLGQQLQQRPGAHEGPAPAGGHRDSDLRLLRASENRPSTDFSSQRRRDGRVQKTL